MYTRHSVDLVAGLAESPMIATKHTVIVFFSTIRGEVGKLETILDRLRQLEKSTI